MSVINDALKRAQEVQETSVPVSVSNLQLRPVEPAPPDAPVFRLTLSSMVFLTVVFTFLVLGVFWLRVVGQKSQAQVAAPSADRPTATAVTAPPLHPSATTSSSRRPAGTTAGLQANAAGATNATGAGLEARSTPPPLRLQAVFYNPARPSVIISGGTFFEGDRVRGLRLVRIERNSATLVGDFQTNVLKLY
jgi:hypothetical protein